MATAVIRRNDLSGTGYTVDVSALELDSNVLIKDFIVSHNGVDRTSSYTKTNANTITYAGTSVTLGTLVNIERDTSLLPSETSFLSVTTASELTNALDKLRRRVEEADAYATYVSQQLLAAGISIGTIPILDNAYAASWDGDTTRAPSRNAVYDRLVTIPTFADMNTALALKSNLASPTFSGAPLVPTPAYGTTDTQAINRAYARGMIVPIYQEFAPAFTLTTTSTTVGTVNFSLPAGFRAIVANAFFRFFNPTATNSTLEVAAIASGGSAFVSYVHSHSQGTGLEQTTITLPVYSPAPPTGGNSIIASCKAISAPSARLDQLVISGFAIA